MDAAERKEILSRYMDHQRRFEAVAAKRQNGNVRSFLSAAHFVSSSRSRRCGRSRCFN
jgi:hypothetical protein